jgi:hypothetical protein
MEAEREIVTESPAHADAGCVGHGVIAPLYVHIWDSEIRNSNPTCCSRLNDFPHLLG